ncbi:MAG: hypothetical protein ACTSUE_15660 [Promethearchaeota archaeon]
MITIIEDSPLHFVVRKEGLFDIILFGFIDLILAILTFIPAIIIGEPMVTNIVLSILIPFDVVVWVVSIFFFRSKLLVREVHDDRNCSYIRIVDRRWKFKNVREIPRSSIKAIQLGSAVETVNHDAYFIRILLKNGENILIVPYHPKQDGKTTKKIHSILTDHSCLAPVGIGDINLEEERISISKQDDGTYKITMDTSRPSDLNAVILITFISIGMLLLFYAIVEGDAFLTMIASIGILLSFPLPGVFLLARYYRSKDTYIQVVIIPDKRTISVIVKKTRNQDKSLLNTSDFETIRTFIFKETVERRSFPRGYFLFWRKFQLEMILDNGTSVPLLQVGYRTDAEKIYNMLNVFSSSNS